MADFIKGLFGGAQPAQPAASQQSGDADFADFAAAPSPEAAPSPSLGSAAAQETPQGFTPQTPYDQRPYTKWYRIHERTSISDFYVELFILPFILVLVAIHIWGTRKNKSRAKAWISTHAPTLANEFAVVGFGGGVRLPSADEVAAHGLAKASEDQNLYVPEKLIKAKGHNLYLSYATGRQNIAFVDVKINLIKRYNPPLLLAEQAIGLMLESFPAETDNVQVVCYPFDGRENDVVPRIPGSAALDMKAKSSYEGFIWAVAHKDRMRKMREDRYDLSLTVTKENAKLPEWAIAMSESAEITDMLLTSELVTAIKNFGEDFESLIVSDLPADAPKTLNELIPKKRVILNVRLGSSSTTPDSPALLATTIKLVDQLISLKLRPEVLKRVRATRDEEAKKIKRVDELEKAEGRKTQADKTKKDERDRKLKGMNAEEQKKFLEKEREREQKRNMSRRSVKA